MIHLLESSIDLQDHEINIPMIFFYLLKILIFQGTLQNSLNTLTQGSANLTQLNVLQLFSLIRILFSCGYKKPHKQRSQISILVICLLSQQANRKFLKLPKTKKKNDIISFVASLSTTKKMAVPEKCTKIPPDLTFLPISQVQSF